MLLLSTRDSSVRDRWSDAVLRGLAPDGGLYLPIEIPKLSEQSLKILADLPFSRLAFELSRLFLGEEVEESVLREICSDAFNFEVPLVQISESTFVLELFHGPTCAFKDFGARFMARLFRYFLRNRGGTPLTVLVATSGDTGGAVANAFFDTSPDPLIHVAILFPKGKVSHVQEKQMTTLGHNVTAFEVDGTFDDCQALVKRALADAELGSGRALTSANSINIARLLPQMFYYMHAALKVGAMGAPIFSVPSGNLGNLTGGIIGHMMGMPASHFIAACNVNAPFPDYIESGAFRPGPSQETISNAMDVGNPSNFARLLALYKGDLARVRASISGAKITDRETLETIGATYRSAGYLLDPHSAVGALALTRYQATHNSRNPGIVLATAHPGKFSATVTQGAGVEPTLPPQLTDVAGREGSKVKLPNSYEEFRSQLMRG